MNTISMKKSSQFTLKSGRNAFTLLELLIVLAILGAIAAMVVPNLLGSQKKANIMTTESSIHGLEQALKLYAVDNQGTYPTGGSEVIESLMSKTDKDGNAVDPLIETLPLDAWGNPLMYEYPNTKAETTKPAIWSFGPDKKDDQGDGDDINNWTEEHK